MPGSVNIKTVAAHAGVSVGTVSNFLRGAGCKAATREKIERAVRELHYIPNPQARAITAAKSGVIAVLIEQRTLASGLWLQTYLLALIQAAGERGLQCRIENVDGGDAYPAECLFRRADGVVLIGHFPAAFFTEFAAVPDMPVTAFWDAPDYPAAAVIPYDFPASLRAALAMLRAAGHARVGFVCDNAGVGAEKIRSWLRLSAEMLPEARCAWVEAIDGFREARQGFSATRTLLSRCPELTAVVFGGDIVAMAGLNAIASLRKTVPGDISAVSLDNSYWAHTNYPAVASVGLDFHALAALIIGIIADGAPAIISPAALAEFSGNTIAPPRQK